MKTLWKLISKPCDGYNIERCLPVRHHLFQLTTNPTCLNLHDNQGAKNDRAQNRQTWNPHTNGSLCSLTADIRYSLEGLNQGLELFRVVPDSTWAYWWGSGNCCEQHCCSEIKKGGCQVVQETWQWYLSDWAGGEEVKLLQSHLHRQLLQL